jgi:hypothetical protein
MEVEGNSATVVAAVGREGVSARKVSELTGLGTRSQSLVHWEEMKRCTADVMSCKLYDPIANGALILVRWYVAKLSLCCEGYAHCIIKWRLYNTTERS